MVSLRNTIFLLAAVCILISYLSRVSQKLSFEELVALLVKARQRNALAGIAGARVYGEGQFMQILEGKSGRPEPLRACWAHTSFASSSPAALFLNHM
jgi:hypothetical protein